MSKYKYILWDWNGTLIDDMSANLVVINNLLAKRGLPILTQEKYRQIFRFPIIDFYRDAGFNVTGIDYEKLVVDYQIAYSEQKEKIKLMDNAELVLRTIQRASIEQLILSASSHDAIMDQIINYNIYSYFISILSLTNAYAYGKMDIAKHWILETGIDPNSILIIGDTLHDYEVATELGCDCLLISKGHQDLQSVRHTFSCNCISDIIDVLNYVI